jgi:pyrroloquinoline-quinone synthase
MAFRKNSAQPKTILEMLDALIERHHLLKHPFYRAWTEGSLPMESLQVYAEQYYQHVRAFPENLKQLSARTSGKLAELVSENISEELNPEAPHPMLWRHFAYSLGVSDAALDRARPYPGVAALLDTYDEISSQGSGAQAVACFYAYEAQVPRNCHAEDFRTAALLWHHRVSRPGLFAVHEKADVRHRAAWRNWLANDKDADSFSVLCAAERSLKALWGALDAVYPLACAAKN